MSQKEEAVTVEALLEDIIGRVEKMEFHLATYQEKVRTALLEN